MRITISIGGKQRKRLQTGDRRTTKKYGEQVRLPCVVRNRTGEVVGYDCTGGRQNYRWCDIDDVPPEFQYLLKEKHS